MFHHLYLSALLTWLLFTPAEALLFWWLKPFDKMQAVRWFMLFCVVRDILLLISTTLSLRFYFNTFWLFEMIEICWKGWIVVEISSWNAAGKISKLALIPFVAVLIQTVIFFPPSHHTEHMMEEYEFYCLLLLSWSVILLLIFQFVEIRYAPLAILIATLTGVDMISLTISKKLGYFPTITGLLWVANIWMLLIFSIKISIPSLWPLFGITKAKANSAKQG